MDEQQVMALSFPQVVHLLLDAGWHATSYQDAGEHVVCTLQFPDAGAGVSSSAIGVATRHEGKHVATVRAVVGAWRAGFIQVPHAGQPAPARVSPR